MTYQEIVEKIYEHDREITVLTNLYRRQVEFLRNLDQQIMTLHKAKWSLERQLVKTRTIDPGVSGIRQKHKKAITELTLEEFASLVDRLPPDKREALLASLETSFVEADRSVQTEEDDTDD